LCGSASGRKVATLRALRPALKSITLEFGGDYMRRIILASLAASLLVFAAAADAKKPSAKPSGKPAEIDVMTQNQYLGADLVPVVEAGAAVLSCDPPEICSDPAVLAAVIASRQAFNAALLNALGMVAANLPEQRYVALAREISGRRADVVGLQEVFEFICTPPGPDDPNGLVGNGCDYGPIVGAFNDHLQGTLDALHGSYVDKAIVKNLDITLPIVTPVGGAYVTVIDRDVILVRRDLAGAATVVPYAALCASLVPSRASADGCNYSYVAATSIAGSTVRIERGFVGIDLTVDGSTYRVVNTHLEVREPDSSNPYSRFVQSAQAQELIYVTTTVMAPEAGRKLIIVGDINSDPRDLPLPAPVPGGAIVPPYMLFAGNASDGFAGFTDAWTMRPGASTGKGWPLVGLSCCQDEDLANRHSKLYERIDMVFSLVKPSKVMDARLIGATPESKTWPPGHGLWPSDHAAVAAELRY
jgi:hypothetical protein